MRCTTRKRCIRPLLAQKFGLLLGRALHKQTTLDALVSVTPAARQDAPSAAAGQPAVRQTAAKRKRHQMKRRFVDVTEED